MYKVILFVSKFGLKFETQFQKVQEPSFKLLFSGHSTSRYYGLVFTTSEHLNGAPRLKVKVYFTLYLQPGSAPEQEHKQKVQLLPSFSWNWSLAFSGSRFSSSKVVNGRDLLSQGACHAKVVRNPNGYFVSFLFLFFLTN